MNIFEPSLITIITLFSISILVLSILPSASLQLARHWSLISSFLPLIYSLWLWQGYDSTGQGYQYLSYLSGLHITLGLDGVGLSLVILTTSIFPICVMLLRTVVGCVTFLVLELLILGALIVLDLLGFYILFEATLVLLFLVIARYPYGNIKAAYLIVLYTAGCSLVILPVIFGLYSVTGSTNLLTLITSTDTFMTSTNLEMIFGWGLLLVFGVKIPLMPLHLWLPEAHVAAPTAGSVLLAGVLLKLGGLGFLRFLIPVCPTFSVYVLPLVSTLCLISFVYASLSTIKQIDLKKIVAYSSIAHMSLVTLTIFSQSEYSATSSSFMMIAHGLVSPGLFVLVGALYDRTHTKLVMYFQGLGVTMPLFSCFFFMFTLANLSFPLFPNFIAEVLCLASLLAVHESLAYIFCVCQVLSAAYGFFAIARIVTGLPLVAKVTGKTTVSSLFCANTKRSGGGAPRKQVPIIASSNAAPFNSPFVEAKSGDLSRQEFMLLLPLLVGALWLGLKPMP